MHRQYELYSTSGSNLGKMDNAFHNVTPHSLDSNAGFHFDGDIIYKNNKGIGLRVMGNCSSCRIMVKLYYVDGNRYCPSCVRKIIQTKEPVC